MSPSISVVIPSLNAPTIQATLESIYAQRNMALPPEIIVVGQDRGGYIRPDTRLTMIETPQPLAPAAARNYGAALSSGEMIVFVDSDVILLPDTLSTICARLQQYDAVGGSVVLEATEYWQMVRNIMSFFVIMDSHVAELRIFLPSMLIAVRRTSWDMAGGFDTSFSDAAGEDIEWGLRANRKGLRLWFEPTARAWHRPAGVTMRSSLAKMRQYGASWPKVYALGLRKTHQFPYYLPRARIEYLLRLVAIDRHTRLPASLMFFWIWSWIVSVSIRDILLMFRSAALRHYMYALPGLLLLQFNWYAGLLIALRQSADV
jgi:glycosyltransferase involved in cell wall biosynthesis